MFLPWHNAKQKRVFWLLFCVAMAMSAVLWYMVSRHTYAQQPSHSLVIYGKVMLSIFVALVLFSLAVSLYRPLEPTPEKAARLKKLIVVNWFIMLAAVLGAVQALVSKQYYMLWASALLFGLVLPLIVSYIRVRIALEKHLPRQ